MRYIAKKGLDLIKHFEGFSNKIYLDSADLLTIGYGHLILPHETLLFQDGITEAHAESILKQDLAKSEKAVSRLIKIPLTQNQFDSLVSFTFNLGTGALQRSTLRAKVNRKEHEYVPAEFLRWIYAGGRKIPGLVKRRMAEANLYQS